MCNRCKPSGARKIDKCMKEICFGMMKFKVLGSCCGHGKYPPSIVVRNDKKEICEWISGKMIPRKRKFYKKDKQGHYYIPEVVKDFAIHS